MVVFVTAPHAGCFNYIPTRHCDRLAEKAANNLSSFLPESKVFIGQAYRPILDLNRDSSLQHPFREKLRQEIHEISPDFVVDVHSFPEDAFDDGDVVIIDEEPMTNYGYDLYQYLTQETFYEIKYLRGVNNSIMAEMRRMGIPAILIEYKETLSDEDLEAINGIIALWLEINRYSETRR